MFNIGDVVNVKTPFSESFPGSYVISDVVHSADSTIAYILGEHGGFDAIYLELVP